MFDFLDVRGRVAWITGGASGIGAATASLFAQAGASVAIADVRQQAAHDLAGVIARRGGQAAAFGCDVANRVAVEAAVAQIGRELGRLDYLVTCAGVLREGSVQDFSERDWDVVVDTHLKGTFLCAQAALRMMAPRRYGKMVFVSSGAARGSRGHTAYSSAKGGVESLTRTLALDLGPLNINVNAVAPGFIDTNMTRLEAERLGIDFEERKRQRAALTAMNKVGKPEDVAALAVFLCSERAAYMTGQVISVRCGP